MTASVVSAAILEGNLIIGLSDGSVINCGYVQGPPGLSGEPGPMGSTGDSGRDGNTIITVAGTPRNDAGKDGDYAIDNVNWRIFGPKAGGVWGKANDMLPSKDNLIVNGRGFEGGAGGGGDTGGGGGGGEGIRLVKGGDGIKTQATSSTVTEVEVDPDTSRGLAFYAEKLGLNIGEGLEFDAFTGQLKSTSDDRLPYRIETDKVLREGKPELRSGEAEIQLVDNQDNYSNVKFAGTNGVDVSSTAASIIIDGSKLAGDITADLASYATIAYSDGKDDNLQNQIDELQIQKGAAANYDCKNNSSSPYNARAGEVAFNNELSSAVTILGLGADDKSGRPTKSIQQGDIIEIVGLDGSDTRYKVTDSAGAPTYILVNYIAGEQGFALDIQYTVYIYPQNEAGATKEYVDLQDDLKLDLAGGTLTGPLVANGPVTINGNATYNGTSNEEESLVNRKYVDDKVNTGGDFLPITGGTMLGNLEFGGGAEIKATGTSSLDNRVSLNINAAGGKPVGISSGSSFESALSIFGYDNGSPNNRKQVINLKANGGIEATGSYVGQLIKSIRNTGYAFEAKPDNVETTALIRTNGSADFTNKLTLLKADTTDHSGFTIKGTVNGGTEGNLLQSYHNAGTLVDAVNYKGKIDEATNIVNKGYVDNLVGPKPAQLSWLWEGDKGSTTTAPATGKFLRTESSGTDYIRLNFESFNGVDLGDTRFGDTNVSLSNGPVGCLWYYLASSGKWRLRMQFRIQSWRWNYDAGGGPHFEFGFSSRHGRSWSDLSVGAEYYITVGGFF